MRFVWNVDRFSTRLRKIIVFSSVGQIQSHLFHQSVSITHFSTHPCKLFSVTQVMHATQVNMDVNIPTPPQPSDVTKVVHVTQVNIDVNIPTPTQPSDVTQVLHVTQVNMDVNIPTPTQWRDASCACDASCMRRKLTWTLTSPPHPNPVTWRKLCIRRKLTWTTPIQWRDASCASDAS